MSLVKFTKDKQSVAKASPICKSLILFKFNRRSTTLGRRTQIVSTTLIRCLEAKLKQRFKNPIQSLTIILLLGPKLGAVALYEYLIYTDLN